MSSSDGEHPPGLFAYMALFVDYYIFPGKFCFINHHGILNREENLKYAHVLVDMEMKYNPEGYPSFLVGISTPGPIIRAIRYGGSIGQMLQRSVRNAADIKKLPGIHGGFRGVVFYD